jgi:transposase
MTKAQVEAITSVQRRRRWSREEKERIVAAAIEPCPVASEVARAAGMQSSQLFRWRQQLFERAPIPAVFNPMVAVTPDPEAISPRLPERAGLIEIEFAGGGRMRISGPVDALTVSALAAASYRVRASTGRIRGGAVARQRLPVPPRAISQGKASRPPATRSSAPALQPNCAINSLPSSRR